MHIHWAWHEQSKPGICHDNRKVGREGRGRSRKIILVSLTLWHGGVSVSEIIDGMRSLSHCMDCNEKLLLLERWVLLKVKKFVLV